MATLRRRRGCFLGWSSSRQAPLYSATATIVINQAQNAANPYADPFSQVQAGTLIGSTYERLVTTEPVLTAAITRLGLPLTVDDLRLQVGASAAPTPN